MQEKRIWTAKNIRKDGRACAVSQEELILNMNEIGYETHLSLNFPFKFGGIIPILLKNKPV